MEREERDTSRQCIGCKCCRVPWNQGSDYCDKCVDDSEYPERPMHDEEEVFPSDPLTSNSRRSRQ